MPISVTCPQGHALRISSRFAGVTVRCPKCSARVKIPGEPTGSDRPKADSQPRSALAAIEKIEKRSPPPLPSTDVTVKQPPQSPPPKVMRPAASATEEAGSLRGEPAKPPKLPEAASPAKRHSRGTQTSREDASRKTPPPPPTEFGASESPASTAETPPPTAGPGESLAEGEDSPTKGHSEKTPLRGYSPTASRRTTVRRLALSLAALALVGAWPAGHHIVDYVRSLYEPEAPIRLAAGGPMVPEAAPQSIGRWALGVLLVCCVQWGYAAYLALIPDFSTVRVATYVCAASAAVYGIGLGIGLGTLFWNQQSSGLLEYWNLYDVARHGVAARWCFIMLCLSSLLMYFCGRVGHRWRKTYRLETLATPGGA